MCAWSFKDECRRGWAFPLIFIKIYAFFFPILCGAECWKIQRVALLQYVNRGLLNLKANGWLRGWGGCGHTLNGKPALLCAVVMAGDYLAMQKDWMNAPPQIGRPLSLLPTDLSLPLSFQLLIIYIAHKSDVNALITPKWRLRDVRLRLIFLYTLCYLSLEVGFVIAFVCKQCSITK